MEESKNWASNGKNGGGLANGKSGKAGEIATIWHDPGQYAAKNEGNGEDGKLNHRKDDYLGELKL